MTTSRTKRPAYWASVLADAANGLRTWAAGEPCPTPAHARFIADRLVAVSDRLLLRARQEEKP